MQGAGRGVHLRRCPSEGRVNGERRGARRQAPPPAPGKGNQRLGAELCSPPPEPEVAPRPEAGNGRGNRVPSCGGGGGVSLGLGGVLQLHGLNPCWFLGLPRSPVLPTERRGASGLGALPVQGRPLPF